MTINYTNKMFGTLWAKHLVTFEELCEHKQKTERDRAAITSIVDKKNRHKYWYCVCTACQKVYIVRSDYLNRKMCRCQRHRSKD